MAPQVDVPDDIAAQVEVELSKQRAEMTARLVAERTQRDAIAAARVAAQSGTHAVDLAAIKLMLRQAGLDVVPAPRGEPAKVLDVPKNDYSKTEHVQLELHALLDLLGVVRVVDVIEHVRREDGAPMTESNARYHMIKLANRGEAHMAVERYHTHGLGWRTRYVWSKDPQKLLEVLEGKKIVKQ